MKALTFISLFALMIWGNVLYAQNTATAEKFGKTLNLGIGLGYYGYVGSSMPVFHANFEIDVVKNFTLAPFISFYSYRKGYKNEKFHDGYRYYYHETVVPVGVKGAYYFDNLLKANPKWDFYLAGSLGFAYTHSYWDDGYDGDKNAFRNARPLYLDAHIGAEYHFNERIGAFLDLSSGASSIGLAIHKF